MTPQIQVLEEVSRVAPLGMRFWDVSAATPAEPGLAVAASPNSYPELISPANWNASGIYSFSSLPGLRRAENGAGDDTYWSSNPPAVAYTISVSDPQNRYLPFNLRLPLPWRGLYGLAASPLPPVPVPDATWLPVFPTPARPGAGVAGMIRATLQDPTGAGAAWAMVTAQAPGAAPAVGLADNRGVISLPMPYPELQTAPAGSPLALTPLKLSAQSWTVEIHVYWTGRIAASSTPDLEQLLQQDEGFAWRDTAFSAHATSFTLDFGTDLILRSVDANSGRQLPYLLVTAAGSPL